MTEHSTVSNPIKKFKPCFIAAEEISPGLVDSYKEQEYSKALTLPQGEKKEPQAITTTSKSRMNLLYLCSGDEKKSDPVTLKWVGVIDALTTTTTTYCSIPRPLGFRENVTQGPVRTVTVNMSPVRTLKTPIAIRPTPGTVPTQVMSMTVTTTSTTPIPESSVDFHSRGVKRSFSHVTTTTTTTLNVLYAEDNDVCRMLTTRIAKLAGVQCDTVEDGLECCKKIEENPHSYDLILMDIVMPGMDGIDAAERIRQLGYNIPIVAISGAYTKDVKQRCSTVGMNGFLTKPLTISKLKEVLSQQKALA
jgi:CheY-like chemotaxis protein